MNDCCCVELTVTEDLQVTLDIQEQFIDGGGITPTGTKTINVTENGTTATDVTYYANAKVVANVPNTYAAADEGKVVQDGDLESQTTATFEANDTYDTTTIKQVTVDVPASAVDSGYVYINENDTVDVVGYAQAVVDVPNTYTEYDEGKVVDDGELVAQGSATYTINSTYDTTKIKSVTVNVSGGGSPTLQTKSVSYTPSESQQTAQVTADEGYDALQEVDVTVGAVSSSYVGSGITRRDGDDLTASGPTVSVPAGYYESSASKSVASGTAGTPSATKGEVSNHSIEVTPSVTNSAGYIASETKTGTAVTVSASELVSGTKSITANGTGIDVTNYEKVDVNVSGGGGSFDFFDLSKPQGDITTSATALGNSSAYGRTGITSITSATVTKVYTNAMYGCTGLQEINLPSLIGFGGDNAGSSSHTSAFRGCTSLSTVKAPSAQWVQGQMFYGCTSLQTIVLPSCTKISNQCFYGDNHLEAADFGGATFQMTDQNIFNNCSAFDTLIIRASSVATLSNINHFNGTPFASSGTGGTLYVPSSLVSSYQNTTNWSTILGYANNQIKSIESTHTDPTAPIDLTLYYADGTPIT